MSKWWIIFSFIPYLIPRPPFSRPAPARPRRNRQNRNRQGQCRPLRPASAS